MKIIPEIIVTNPNDVSKECQDFANKILAVIQQRVLVDSKTYKNIEANLYIYIGINVNVNKELLKPINENFYYGSDDSLRLISETVNLNSTVRQALKNRVEIIGEIKECFVYLSLSPIDKKKLTSENNEKEENIVYHSIDPIFTLDEVVMNQDERDAIMRAISLVKEKDLVYNKWGFSKVDKHTKSVLCFHGVPGTGKTMAAHGVASFLGKKILIGSYAQIESEFVGVGAKNLKAFFDCAAQQDAVLFIDEADTFLSKRLPSSNDSAKHYNSMSNELYQLVESFDGCIIFASNHIKDFDPAIISRIIEPIEFKLPDLNARKKILSNLLQDEFPIEGGKTEDLITELAEITDGFSGRDIRKALLICNADAAYKLKIKSAIEADNIIVPINMIRDCFDSVRKAKNKLDEALGKKTTGNLISEFTENNQRKTRYMQMAAHTLLADEIIESREKMLYETLSKTMGVKVPLEKDSLPSVEAICSKVSSVEEKMQIFDVVTRMAACDENVPENEMNFVIKAVNLLGLGCAYDETVVKYTQGLADSYRQMALLKDKFGKSDMDILLELKKEYSEGAAYYHLAEMYRDGSNLMGGIERNETKAIYYFKLAAENDYRPISSL